MVPSPACGGRSGWGRGWFGCAASDTCPHPSPPPQAGEGACQGNETTKKAALGVAFFVTGRLFYSNPSAKMPVRVVAWSLLLAGLGAGGSAGAVMVALLVTVSLGPPSISSAWMMNSA